MPRPRVDLISSHGRPGPVVVSIAVGDNNTDFRDYEGGVYDKDNKCGFWNDHELLLVGYDSNTYILKNSYGDDWGDEGYLILPRPDTNCGMLREGGSYRRGALHLWSADRCSITILSSSTTEISSAPAVPDKHVRA